ncbi:MAG: hypothetical protein COW32_09935 [Candidatus Aquicultor secundus]|uniref:CRISPR-associated protein n=1 Tax=Candidatus Aquicultor secundus TaxID=1973895 RepID=A0A2M7T994_9ACTN|nr:hypothetical protein [Candidatus Aquicultor secundus]NCO65281.1 hypothetical protein [Solirubrobacter sp.]OIO83557.1 MAG: hypothetical protein AUK32_09840 [Candidatus Aquicultor secundus]PIU27239.1 MAG: hypothetical protein COT10_04495 [Candidatus Aquicultor secundus]PIW21443.1 MAG: hypothetical protein COW32_09935 [Candidatus Aquicultor secundus]PIX51687.1 MAG: hypothetical protein COZ51_08225 [Candidatus Aquicultor secundus]
MHNGLHKLFSVDKASPIIFLVVIYIVGISTGSLADTLQIWLKPWVITVVGSIALILIMAFVDPIPRFINYVLGKRGELSITDTEVSPQRHRGLIVLGSAWDPMPAETAIRYHYKGIHNEHHDAILDKCWLLTAGETSNRYARDMIAKLIREGMPNDLFKIVELSAGNADNPAKVYDAVEDIFASLPDEFGETDMIADYTGGTKSMTAGLILACARPSRKLQVLKPKEYKEDGTAVREAGSDPKSVDIRFNLTRA